MTGSGPQPLDQNGRPAAMREIEYAQLRAIVHARQGLLIQDFNGVGHGSAFSRRIAPEVCIIVCPLGEQRAQGRPGACCTRGLACNLRKQKRTRAYRAAGAFRPSLRNGFTAYFVLSPENGSFASVATREASPLPDLAPAPRRPNHTTSPYASGAYVYRALSVHRISPRVRDDREAPLICRETGEVVRLIWVRTKAEYF